MAAGKVWLVGAGPGDIGLFTLKGAAVLQQADVVVYDSLVGEGVLAKIPEHARLINVGKRANHHTMVQEDINKVLLEEAEKGNKVVRLKGGDPFLFGRGGEELELLSENGIPYEIIPGVTSPISVPAYNGIPVTHRDFCSSLHIITGHKRAGQEYDIDFKATDPDKGNTGVSNGNCSTGGYLQRASCRWNGSGYAGSSSSERNNSRTEAGGCYCRYPQGRGGQTGDRDTCHYCCGKGMFFG